MAPKAFGADTSGDDASPLQPAARRSRSNCIVTAKKKRAPAYCALLLALWPIFC
jgi:hypothetical protein